MRTLKALKSHTYGGKLRKVGDIYEASKSHSNLMVLTGNAEIIGPEKAKEVEKPELKTKRPYVRHNMTAAATPTYSTKVMTDSNGDVTE